MDWIRLRDEQLNPDDPGRYPPAEEWEALKREWCGRDYVLSIDGGSFYGYLRDWIGFEELSYMLYDQPDLVHEMMDYLADFFIQVLHKAVDDLGDGHGGSRIDFGMFWEDMCYKNGPLISPRMFQEFCLPYYMRLTAFFRDHGVSIIHVDTDGDAWKLIPLFLEGGVTGLFPMEVAAKMDVRSSAPGGCGQPPGCRW